MYMLKLALSARGRHAALRNSLHVHPRRRGVLAVMVLAAAGSAGPMLSKADPSSDDRLNEVVVTARKRAENLQEVPISVAAYTSSDLQAQSLETLADVAQMTPNLLYGQKIQSGSSAGELYIRGVGQQDTQGAFNPSVGLYVDGVYLARPTADDIEMLDVQRLEVLYGPQGTLFGKNTNGGAINVVTRSPDLTMTRPTGTMQLQGGDYDRFDADGSIDLPLASGKAALLLTASRRTQSGYSVRIDGQDQANQNRSSGRAKLLVKLADSVEATLSLDGTHLNERSSAYRLVAVRTASTIPTLYANFTPYRYDDRWVTASDFNYNGTGPNENAGHVWGTSLSLNWDSPWGSLKSITAYRTLSVESEFDPDGSPLTILDVFNSVRQHQISQELQWTGKSNDRLDWVFGLYYFRETVDDDQPVNIALEYFNGAANFNPLLHIVNQNYAAYGQATLALSNRLKLTLGARAGNDRADVGRLQVDYPIPTIEQPFVRGVADWNSLLPRAGLTFQWTPDLMIYSSASEGSKSGGYNGRAGSIAEFNRYDPEKVWSFELGLRSDWLDRRLRLNATAFYSLYRDFQILLNRSVTVDGKPTPFSFVGNMPRASIRGGELTLQAIPMSGLRLLTGLGVTDGRYEEILAGAPVTLQSQFVDTPKFTVTAGTEYTTHLGARYQLVSRVDYVHKSTIQFDYGNSPYVAQRPYGVLNARLTLQMPDPDLSVFVFGQNLTDTHYAVGGLDDGPTGSLGEIVKQMGPPREWGFGARYRF